LPFSIDLAGRH